MEISGPNKRQCAIINRYYLVPSLMPARRTSMPCRLSGGSSSSSSQALFGGSATGIWRAVIRRWHPVTGGGFPTTSMPPLKTSQGIFGSFKVSNEGLERVVWFTCVPCAHKIVEYHLQ